MDWTIFQSHHIDNEEKPSLEENAQAALVVKITPARAGDVRDVGSIPGSGRSPGGGHGNPLQYSCLENPMDRGAWWATVHGVAKSRTRLSNFRLQSEKDLKEITFVNRCYSEFVRL